MTNEHNHEAKAAPAVPQGWKLVPVEPTDDEIRRAVNLPFVEDASGTEWVMLTPKTLARAVRRVLAAAPAPAVPQGEPVAVIGSGWTFLWASGDAIEDIVKRHGLKIGSKLYAAPSKEPTWDQNADVCKGAWILGTACGKCAKCIATKPASEPVTLTRYRVWPDGTVQDYSEGNPYAWKSDDYALIDAESPEQAIIAALREKEQTK